MSFYAPTVPTATRLVAPTHRPFVPDEDQEAAIRFFVGQYIVAAFADIGAGKTGITLEAFRRLKALGRVQTMLVVAPVKVCYETWPPEIAKWTQFKDFKTVILHGRDKKKRLKEKADIYIINYEGLAWLSQQYAMRKLPFDIVVFDELTKMRNSQSERFKAIRPRLKGVRHRWGLTGTPVPNGYMNLFGQLLILDNGAALGPYITHYREKYFVPSFDGFNYNLKAGADKQIEQRIKPYVVRLVAKNLPPVFPVPHVVKLPPAAQKAYNAMKKDMLAQLGGDVVSAVNAGAAYSKLLQMANGAVYIGEGKTRQVIHLHDEKLNELEDIIESLNGEQLLVAYAFRHDLERLLKRWPGTPYLGGDVTTKQASEAVQAWNKGRTQLMFVHPASAGHGLNLQLSGAHHIAWFGITWDRELFDQLIGRLVRRGQEAKTVYNHLIMVEGSLDVEAIAALVDKDMTQRRMLDRLNALLHSVEVTNAADVVAQMESEMAGFKKMDRQADAKSDDRGGDRDRDDRGRDDNKSGGTPKGWAGRAGGEDEDDRRPREDDRRGGDRDRDRDDGRGRDRDDGRDRDRPRDDDRGRDRDDDRDRDRDRDRDDDRPRSGFTRGRDADREDQKERVTDKIAPRDEREPAEEPRRDARDISDRPDDRAPPAGENSRPAGWGKPGEKTEEAPPTTKKRETAAEKKARLAAEDAAKEPGDKPLPEGGADVPVMTVEEVAKMTGRTGSAAVGVAADGDIVLTLALKLPMDRLAAVLKALGVLAAPF